MRGNPVHIGREGKAKAVYQMDDWKGWFSVFVLRGQGPLDIKDKLLTLVLHV